MAFDKTLTDVYRRELDFDKYTVLEALPGHFDESYPELVKFLQEYYRSFEEEDAPTEKLNDLLLSRDITQAKAELLSFISNELLLGKPYFEGFNDKRTALQYSNLLYRSKGTDFSIQQFFRIFYGLDVDIRYGKNEVFYIGDPSEEVLRYTGNGPDSGSNFSYTFRGADILVEVENDSGEFVVLRQDTDYITDFTNQVIVILASDDPVDATDVSLTYMAENGYLAVGKILRITTTRNTSTAIGSDVTDKKITNDKFYQLYGLLISTPVGVATWREAYKTFVHPAGMFLSGQVAITSVFDFDLGPQPSLIEPPPPILIEGTAYIGTALKLGRPIAHTDISEIGPGPYGFRVRTRPNDMFRPTNIGQWHEQYPSLARADDINARTLDTSYGDLSNTINKLDENVYHAKYYDSDAGPLLGWNNGYDSANGPLPGWDD